MKQIDLREKVKSLLDRNMVSGYSKSAQTHFHYTKPSPETYPFQFFWYTCFHVFMLCRLANTDMARKHLVSLFALQKEDGFVGHIIYWNRVLPGRITDIFQSRPGLGTKLLQTHMSALIQPPIVAQAVARLYEATKDDGILREFLPKLKRYYNWIARNRDFDGDGLVTIISPFESGMDWKPTFDPALGFRGGKANWRLFIKAVSVDARNFFHGYDLEKIKSRNYFRVKEVATNTVYIQNLYALAALCRAMNDPDETHFRRLANKALDSLLSLMYDADQAAFYDVYGPANQKIPILTPTIFFPLVIEGMDRRIVENVIGQHVGNRDEFAVPFPLPSVARNHPSFNPEASLFLWRGPTWVFMNWFLHCVLKENGYAKLAGSLVETVLDLIDRSGFREYYQPFTGAGLGADNFTWSGLIIDMMDAEAKITTPINQPDS